MCRFMRKPVFRVSNQVHHKLAVQPQKMVRGLKFRIWIVEGLYYLFRENKGNDQLRSYSTDNGAADLRLCFHICKTQVFS